MGSKQFGCVDRDCLLKLYCLFVIPWEPYEAISTNESVFRGFYYSPPLQVVKKMETSVSGDPAIPFKVKTAFVLVFLNK